MIGEYKIISGRSLEELEDEVNRAIQENGCRPIGGPFLADPSNSGNNNYYQAMLWLKDYARR